VTRKIGAGENKAKAESRSCGEYPLSKELKGVPQGSCGLAECWSVARVWGKPIPACFF
jgi:hypothetical protein